MEAFYDCDQDPHNLTNLLEGSMSEEQQEALRAHRQAYMDERLRLRDPGAIPEDEMWRWVRDENLPLHDILLGKGDHKPDLSKAWRAADLVGRPDFPAALKLLKSSNPIERYWAVLALRTGGYPDTAIFEVVKQF